MRQYGVFLNWLLHDALWRAKGDAFVVVVTAVLGVSLQVSVFWLLIVLLRHIGAAEPQLIGEMTIEVSDAVVPLTGLGAAVVAMLCLSAYLIYTSRRMIFRLGRRYEEYCSQRVFRMAGGHGNGLEAIDGEFVDDAYLARLIRSDSRMAGRVLRRLLTLLVPAMTLSVAAAVLVWLEPLMSGVIFSIGIVLLFYQYRASESAVRYSRQLEKFSSQSAIAYREAIDDDKYRSSGLESGVSADLFSQGPVRRQLDAFEGRLRVVEQSRLASGIFMAVVVGVILVMMGGRVIDQGGGWDRVLVYVVALRFAAVNLQTVLSGITAINRFYPQLGRYFTFVRNASAGAGAPNPVCRSYVLCVDGAASADVPDGSLSRVEIGAGGRIALVTPLRLNRYTLSMMVRSLFWSDENHARGVFHSSRYVSPRHSCPRVSLRQMLELGESVGWADLRKWFPDDDFWNRTRRLLPGNLDRELSQGRWRKVDPDIKVALSAISARMSGAAWIFFDADGVAVMRAELLDFYMNLFCDSFMVVVYNDRLNRVGTVAETSIVLTDERTVLGIYTEMRFRCIEKEVSELLSFSRRSRDRFVDEDASEYETM